MGTRCLQPDCVSLRLASRFDFLVIFLRQCRNGECAIILTCITLSDHSITENELFYLRCVNEEGLLNNELADIVPMKSVDATVIFDAIKTGLDSGEMYVHKHGWVISK